MSERRDPAQSPAEFTPSDEQLDLAQYYICQERHLFHRYCILDESPAFPLFFMDRCYDWQFESTGDVPIISRYNGFMELVCRESWVETTFAKDELAAEIGRAIASGAHVALPVSFVHSDGTPYVTEWLVEVIDEDTIYYTKSTSDIKSRAFRRPVPFSELLERVVCTDDGRVSATEIHPSSTVDRILGMGSLEAFRAVFREFGLRWEEGRLYRYVNPVVVGVEAIDQAIDAWEQRAESIVTAGTVSFNDTSRLNKHVQNRFQPVQHFLQFLLSDAEIGPALGDDLVTRIRGQWHQMDTALADVLKFGSLVVQQPVTRSFDLYLKYLRRLRDTVCEYQRLIVDIQRALTQ
ncbi:hypothetical protein J2Z21_000926 [Streptomyces griseochromogenes]|uniref:Uncharacterized protein n=1 Tax=Streptomyces griseochromogenes TaxID=68214 RepID=A0A1B1AUS1_9ACTN|nr:hypothetical protein [Streptomyces griseochromogenes]ANP50324.1 hypothetical protein AVL59_12460 [Streptomyces griseochromogenes]MBP2048002.1 hypothetical protein [Streptomyces griseochromogenes]